MITIDLITNSFLYSIILLSLPRELVGYLQSNERLSQYPFMYIIVLSDLSWVTYMYHYEVQQVMHDLFLHKQLRLIIKDLYSCI